MSMWLEYAKVSEATLEAVRKDDAVAQALFFGEEGKPADFDAGKDVIGLDYRTLSAMLEGMEEAGIDCSWTRRAIGEEYGDALSFELTYGPAFFFTVEEVAELAAGLSAEEGWDPDDDFEENIARFFVQAAMERKAVIGGVN